MDFAFPPIAPQPTPERTAERTSDPAEGASERPAAQRREAEDEAGRESAFAAHIERALAPTAPRTEATASPAAAGQASASIATAPPARQTEAAPLAPHDAMAGKTSAAPTDKIALAPTVTTPEPAQPATPAPAAGQIVPEPVGPNAEKNSAPMEIAPTGFRATAAPAPAPVAAPTSAKTIDPQADKSAQAPASPRAPSTAAPPTPAPTEGAEPTLPASQPQADVARAAAPPAPHPDQAPLRAGREDSAPRATNVERNAKSKSVGGVAAPETVAPAPQSARPTQSDARIASTPSPAAAPSGETAATPAPAPAHSAAAAVHDAQRPIDTTGASGAARASTAAGQVAQQIIRRITNGATTFEMQLDPPELGRVEVKLEMSRDHRVSALIAAEDPATLSQIARAAREIETMLEAAGLQLNDSGLTFDLAHRRSAERGAQGESNGAAGVHMDDETVAEAAPQRALLLERWRGARVDLVA